MKHIKFLFCMIIIISLVLVTGCSREKDQPKPLKETTLETAEIISHASSGSIPPGNEITVTFVNPQIKQDMTGSTIKKKVFFFKPNIDGITRWKDRRTLAFKPNKTLPFRKTFSVEVKYNELIPNLNKQKPFLFNFTTSGREITTISGDFEPLNQNNPDLLYYKGELSFTVPIDPQTVKKAVSLSSGNSDFPLQWEAKNKNKSFSFKSDTIKRAKSGKARAFQLKIDNDKTDLSKPFTKEFSLEPPGNFTVSLLRKFDQGNKPGIEIRFSDKLDTNQDITGLIRVSPTVKFLFKAVNKSVFLSGNFEAGKMYSLKIAGIRSKWGTSLKEELEKQIDFEEKKPQFSFLKDGLFLPSANNKKIGFKTMNLKKIKVTVKKVFESNLGQFLQSQQVNARKQRTERFYDYDIKRVGVTVAEKEFKIGETRNQWLTHQLDLAQLIKANEKGLFIISLSFTKKDMLYKTAGKKQNHYYGRGYYSNPDSRGYIYRHGRVVKPVILSDIGLTYKKGASQHLVFASNLLDAKPLKDVTVTIRTFQNQVIATQKTDASGKAFFENIKETVFFLEAEKDGQRSMIKPAEMGWNLSTFDTGGVTIQPQETRAFIYTERGVYRPGDPVNLSVIARNIDNTFPDGHPVTLKLYNPKSQLIVSQTSKKARDGFYNFKFKTKASDPTGSWKAKIHVGSLVFYHTLKIETVVPNRLKVKILPEEKTLSRKNKYIKFDVESTYLFGSPAANLKSKVSITFKHLLKKFPKFQGYSFNNQSVPFRSINTEVFNRNLDPTGKVDISWLLPDLTHLPSAATAAISAKVFEKGGRFTRMDHSLLMDPFDYYVGLEKPNFRWGYSRVGAPLKINAVVLDKDGKTAPGRQLKYRIYKNSRYWWWEYRNRNNFRVRYKKDKYTHLLKEGELISRDIPLPISFKPENTGEYLIEVEDTDKGGHKAGFFFSAYYWGDAPSGMETAGTLTLKSSKKVYAPGETAIISFPEPQTGSLFVTVEKANRILSSTIYACKGGPGEESERKIEIPVTPEMLPNAYVSVSIIQPHSQTLNDRPLRMYGVIPLMVEEPQTRQAVELKMADKLRPKQAFEVKVETGDKKPTQFTVAVVDEGLLDLTRFLTPDPWKEFYKKQKLGIHSFDLFSFVIGATKGDISSLFSIGGGSDDYRKSQEEPGKVKRFKPVAMFKGPLQTDANGKATVTFKMPDYIGSVRVMVVTANGNRYGCTEKAVPVKTELMVMPTLPRVLGPTDKFRVPVTVFAMEDKIKKVDVSIELEGPIELEGTNRSSLEFTGPGDKDTSFVIKTQPAVGSAAVTVTAKSGKFKAVKRTEINIRPSSPRIYSSEIKDCEPKNSIKIKIPDRGIPGTNRAVIRVMRKPKLNLNHRLGWLIRYPYGCIEQTVSSVFPQLYLKEFMKQNDESERDIDSNINEAIEGLSRFQLPSGAFAYWPGDKSASHWGTSYAGHFLLEAKKLGYNVPAELYSRWLRFMESQTLVTSNENVMTRTYRVYVLALAGKPQMGPMNLLKENHLKKMSGTGKWMLAAAYHLAGSKETAKEVFKNASLHVEKYCDTGGTYGSNIRDLAIILEVLTLFEDWNKADSVYDDIMEEISGYNWYATQTIGYSLLAIGKYMRANSGDFRGEKAVISGYIKLPGKKKIPFNTDKLRFSQTIEQGFGKDAEVYINKKTTLKRAFVVMEWNGIPLTPDVKEVSNKLWLSVEWLDENGMKIDPSQIKQGKTFWGHFRVGRNAYSRVVIEELALVQVLPSGWEIENIRLLGEAVPGWMRKWNLGHEEYLDIRDDRIMWFFDLTYYKKPIFDFVVKLNAVTAGEFILPPTLFEAMYNDKYKAIKKGKFVRVLQR